LLHTMCAKGWRLTSSLSMFAAECGQITCNLFGRNGCPKCRVQMKNLSDEQIKRIKVWAKNAKEESEKLTVVLNGIKKQLSKDTESNDVAKCIDANWKEFVGLFMLNMPHVVYNGTKTPVVVDWVEAKETSNLQKAFRQYRYFGEDITTPTNAAGEVTCVGSIEREKEVQKTIDFTHPSGYVQTIPMRDAEGKIITESVMTKFVVREKSIWGYTDTVVSAFINAADELVDLHK